MFNIASASLVLSSKYIPYSSYVLSIVELVLLFAAIFTKYNNKMHIIPKILIFILNIIYSVKVIDLYNSNSTTESIRDLSIAVIVINSLAIILQLCTSRR